MYRYEGTEQIRQDSAPTSGAQKRFMDDFTFDAIVIGAGHAGVEAGLALARTGCRTLMLSVTLDNVAYLACNPSVGGTAKGHLVREIDALGGEMGRAADSTLVQLRMLNRSKGPAVQSLRAQVDKYRYHEYMKRTLETQDNLELRQGEAAEILTENGRVCGVRTAVGLTYRARAVVLACGVYLKSDIIIGPHIEHKGPVCFQRAEHLSGALLRLGIALRRFKTGTPARVHRDSVDFSKLEVQRGETDIYSFSALSKRVAADKAVCWLGWTNERTHDIIRKNLHRAPKYSGLIHGVGARYCPSIEDKIVRFADKERHQFFLEPEGTGTAELYVQGLSTSLPADVQLEMYRSIAGFERVKIMRDAYAIEYDCIDPTILAPTLEHKEIGGLYFAGQINGTSGYEEAAAQGLMAGLNASLALRGRPPLVLRRSEAYIGVMIDDLVTLGTDEPYRMMTSRAESRLKLRQDNADIRLTEKGRQAGLVCDRRYRLYKKAVREDAAAAKLLTAPVPAATAKELLGTDADGAMTVDALVKRGVPAEKLRSAGCFADLSPAAVARAVNESRYAGYLSRAEKAARDLERLEDMPVPADIDYAALSGLRLEAREKLARVRPINVGQAARVRGVTPADVNVLLLHIARRGEKNA